MHYGGLVLRSVRFAKRAIDVAGAAVGLILTAPLMPLIAAAIYIDSPGPVLFRQRRAGSLKSVKSKNGVKELTFEEFDMHKFRTMIPDAEKKTGVVQIICIEKIHQSIEIAGRRRRHTTLRIVKLGKKWLLWVRDWH